jgi:hypothetical protein
MMTRTKPAWIESMRQMAEKLERDPNVNAAWVDDWGRFGNFALHVTPKLRDRSTTRRLKAAVGKALPEGAQLRRAFPPEPIYASRCGRRVRVRWSRRYWNFDIDFLDYDLQTNTFAERSQAEESDNASCAV